MADYDPSVRPTHANILVRGFPSDLDIGSFIAMFRQYGLIEGCRYFPGANIPYAFIKLDSIDSSYAAICGLNNTTIRDKVISVKPAETDCEYEKPHANLYCVNLPLHWTDDDLRNCFAPFGGVLSVRLLSALPGMAGKGGLVRMNSVEEATTARIALNAAVPPGGTLPIMVKYADTAEDKARKSARQHEGAASRQSMPGGGGGGPGAGGSNRFAPYPGPSGRPNAGNMANDPNMMYGQMGAPPMVLVVPAAPPASAPMMAAPYPGAQPAYGAAPGAGGYGMPPPGQPQMTGYDMYGNPTYSAAAAAAQAPAPWGQPGYPQQQQQQPNGQPAAPAPKIPTAVCISSLPASANRLVLYEHFAPFGGITSVTSPAGGMAWVTFVDADSANSAAARMHGSTVHNCPVAVAVVPQSNKGAGAIAPPPAGPPAMGYAPAGMGG